MLLAFAKPMNNLLIFGVGAAGRDFTRWTPIGKKSQVDLIRITYSSTPYISAEDQIHQYALSGGLGYRQGNVLKDFPPQAMIDLKNTLIQFNRWFLMFGMVAMLSAPQRPPFFCVVPDPRSGYFVARYSHDNTVEVGWRFHSQDGLGVPANETRPDMRVNVFVWPGHHPDIHEGQPFRSRLAVLLRLHSMVEEFRDNMLEAEYLSARPPLLTSIRTEGSALANHSVNMAVDVTASATQAVRQGRTQAAHQQLRRIDDQVEEEVSYDDKMDRNYDHSRVVAGYTAEGQRVMIRRGNIWGRRIPLRAGTAVERPPQPGSLQPWVERERYFIETIYRALGVPMRGGSSSYRRNGGSAESTMTEGDITLMRNTVIGTRQNLIDAFSIMYQKFMSETSIANATKHRDNLLNEIDVRIKNLSDYLGFLSKTNQLETEPMFAAHARFAEHEEANERRKAINETVAKIQKEALNSGKFLDAAVITRHLTDIYELRDERARAEENISKDISGMKNIMLEFKNPPLVDSATMLQLGRDGFLNPREAVRYYGVSTGMSEEAVSACLESVDFVPPQRKYEIEAQREQQKAQLALDKQRLELEKTKEENKTRLENKKISSAEKMAADPGQGDDSQGKAAKPSGEKRKSEQETAAKAKKKK